MDQSGKICQHCWKNALISVKFPDLERSTVLKTCEDIQVHVALQVCAPTKKNICKMLCLSGDISSIATD